MQKINNDPEFHKITNRFFWESFFGIFIFGIPAFISVFLGKYLDELFQTGKILTIILLVIAFISSWVIVIWRSKRMNRIYKEYKSRLNNNPENLK
jgi:F0F1-type ATP synthase assembly protein I